MAGRERWFEAFKSVSKLLKDAGIRHSFIKTLFDPFEWGDIDVLIRAPSEVHEASHLLKSDGFAEGSAGKISPPNKKAFEKKDCPPVEIYPRAAWKRLIVADENEILSRSSLKCIDGIEAHIPAPEDEFYLVATHSISHMRITEAEIRNAVRLIDEYFSWNQVYKFASEFGTMVQTYFFLKAVVIKSGSELVSKALKIFNFNAKRLVDAWFGRTQNLIYPVEVPRIFGRFLPALYHEPAILKREPGWNIFYDFLSNFL